MIRYKKALTSVMCSTGQPASGMKCKVRVDLVIFHCVPSDEIVLLLTVLLVSERFARSGNNAATHWFVRELRTYL